MKPAFRLIASGIFLPLLFTIIAACNRDDDSNIDHSWSDVGDEWPGKPNEYSWDGGWSPDEGESLAPCLYDSKYFDGHLVKGEESPILPPGEWDYEQKHTLANWRNFSGRLGTFDMLICPKGVEYGWRLKRNNADGVKADAVLKYFHGSCGMDILDLGPEGSFNSAGNPLYGTAVGLGDGPDILRYRTGHSAAFRTGSSETGHAYDNDLVMIGSRKALSPGKYDVITTTIHTGPGNDLVFVGNFERAAIDLGNGNNGRTDAIDPYDGRDIAIIHGNARDFRVFGGSGNDIFVWYVDEVNQEPNTWLGPNFFGCGGWGDALWGDKGTDRLILGIPHDTQIVSKPSDLTPGSLLIMVERNYKTVVDTPTEHDPYARYYIYAPPGPNGEKTITLQYLSANSKVNTHYFYITAVEELQIGTDDNALLYNLDNINGTYSLAAEQDLFTNIPRWESYEALINSFPEIP